MRIRPEWGAYLRGTRERLVGMVFARCPSDAFGSCLELGAGDGFVSRLLTRYAKEVISTDINPAQVKGLGDPRIHRRVCDAERVDEVFEARQFDLVFSCAVLEHLPDAGRALRGIHTVLKDDGLAIHLVPNVLWKLCHVMLYIPAACVFVLEKMTERGGMRKIRDRVGQATGKSQTGAEASFYDNNPKIQRAPRSVFLRLFVPEPHGVSDTNRAEFRAFSRKRWIRDFEEAGFELVSVGRGPAESGYGFGLRRTRRLLEWLGFSTVTIYLVRKKGMVSPYANFFGHQE